MTQSAEPVGKLLLLRPVPRFDGPYDDEPTLAPRHAVEGNLALAFPRSTASGMPLRLVPPAGALDPVAPAEAIPDPRRLVGPVAQAIAEVLMGGRAPQQLAEIASIGVLGFLERNAGRLVPRGVRVPPRPRITSLRLCEPRHGIAEVAAVIDTGQRRRAMALRLEATPTSAQWRCTVVRVG